MTTTTTSLDPGVDFSCFLETAIIETLTCCPLIFLPSYCTSEQPDFHQGTSDRSRLLTNSSGISFFRFPVTTSPHLLSVHSPIGGVYDSIDVDDAMGGSRTRGFSRTTRPNTSASTTSSHYSVYSRGMRSTSTSTTSRVDSLSLGKAWDKMKKWERKVGCYSPPGLVDSYFHLGERTTKGHGSGALEEGS